MTATTCGGTRPDASGSGIASIHPLITLHALHARLGGVRAGGLEHLVGHVEADRLAGRADAAHADQHVCGLPGAEVEHCLALVQVRHRGWHPRPSDTPSAAAVASLVSPSAYGPEPNRSAASPQHEVVVARSAEDSVAVAYFWRTRMSVVWPAEHPQLSPTAFAEQHDAFSDGSQQVCCASLEQQEKAEAARATAQPDWHAPRVSA